ncbi:MAG: hypothetical protein RLZZ244_1991 [Verrucomicrobiota bacterium]
MVFTASALGTSRAEEFSADHIRFFENKIRPLLAEHCLECHSAEKGKVKAGLNLDNRASLLKGGESGVVLTPGEPDKSTFIHAVEWRSDLQMPPKKRLSAEQVQALREWVSLGLPDPRTGPALAGKNLKAHWAFQPVQMPEVPAPKNALWCKTPVDRFILAAQESAGLLPGEPPETGTFEDQRRKKEALLRRTYFDLIGLPPSPAEIQAFVSDANPRAAYEKVVDKLLADKGFGERWARFWMDTARYSDTAGSGRDVNGEFRYAYAWSYRDWLINAFNADMPYNEFILNQLAADRLPGNSKQNLAALGFLTVGERFNRSDDTLNDRIDAVGRGFLGLTLACARCHDHKFDPITQADYYALKGIFQSTVEPKEGPVIAENPLKKEAEDFTLKLQALEKEARLGLATRARDFGMNFRNHALAYFEAAFVASKRNDPEARKLSAELIAKNKLDGRIVDTLRNRLNPGDPIMGPFLKLLNAPSGKPEILAKLVSENAQKPRYNPISLEFLRQSGVLPADHSMVAALLYKNLRDQIPPNLTLPNATTGSLSPELQSLGIYRWIADPNAPALTPAQQALLDLALFPLSSANSDQLKDIQKLRQQGNTWNLNVDAPFVRMNELKLTHRGGPIRAMVLEDLPTPKDSPLYPRGNRPKPGEPEKIIPRRFIEVLARPDVPAQFTEGSGRLELARAIASVDNPLTARVMVNRVWMHLLGEGLIRTPDDLGNQSGTPSHPELLDYLSAYFTSTQGGAKPAWSLKSLLRLILLSNVYQQSSRSLYMENQKKIDAGNRLLWRANIRRLDFEAFRDSLLSISGKLDRTPLGPSVNLVSEPYSLRRSVYGYLDRANMPDILMQFDVSNPIEPNSKRTSTIVPQQALFLMNSPFTLSVVQNVAQRPELLDAVARRKNDLAGILTVFQVVLQRTPSAKETAMALSFLRTEAQRQAEVLSATTESAHKAQKEAEQKLQASLRNANERRAIVNEGEIVKRTAMTPWETLIQALIFSNEAAYLH